MPRRLKRNPLLQVGCIIALVFACPVHAESGAATPSDGLQGHTHAPVKAEEETPSFTVDVTYTADVWRAARGGVRKGTRYLDNFDIVAQADMERLIGWRGATIGAYGLYNNGTSLSALMGDAQVASNIETGVRALRLYEAWVDQKIGSMGSVKLGLYDLNSEFDAHDTSALFMGSAHGIGTDISQSGENGPSIFPTTSLAARIAITPAKGWAVRAAVLDGVPGDPARPKRTAIKLGDGDGALLVGEVEAPLPNGKLLLGHWRYTARADDLPGTGRRRNAGYYLRGESKLTSERDDAEQGLSAFFRLGLADKRINHFSRFASAGLTYAGPVEGRDKDQLGLAVASARTSSLYQLSTPSTRVETVFELTYRAPIAKWLTVQPNVQYVINPGPDPNLRDALAVGLRLEFGFQLR